MVAASGSNLFFLENKGQIVDQQLQSRTDIHYRLTTNSGPSIFIGAGTMHYQFCKVLPSKQAQEKKENYPSLKHMHQHDDVSYTTYRIDVELVGANKNVLPISIGKAAYYETYYTNGLNGATAHAFSKIIYKDIYPNIDWVIYANGDRLKHEFMVHPGGKVSDIQIKYGGATQLRTEADGSLTAESPMGSIAEHAPITWQQDGKKIPSRFVIKENIVSYAIGEYKGELIIDPALSWATYYGGSNFDFGSSVATDVSGNVYLAGYTHSFDAIATIGAHQQTIGSTTGLGDAFISKFSSSGTRQWSTYYGGSNFDQALGITLDNTGNAVYVCGITQSTEGIATVGSHKETFSGLAEEAFLVKFNNSGVRQWGTYVGDDNQQDYLYVAVVDAAGNVYVGGHTTSVSGIATSGTHQSAWGGGEDGFIVKFNRSGVREWGTYYGGTGRDRIWSLMINAAGEIYACGFTQSTNGIATAGAHQETYGGGILVDYGDCFLVKFNSSGVRLWSTYYGGAADEYGGYVILDGNGNIYLAGGTNSVTGIATPGSYKSVKGPNFEVFLAKFNPSGNRLWGTYFGSTQDDYMNTATSNAGGLIIGGYSTSATGLSTPDGYKTTCGGLSDGYLVQFSPAGALQYATYFGGAGADELYSAKCDNMGNLYVTGFTESNTSIATPGAHDETFAAPRDAFLAKFNGFPVSVQAYENNKSTLVSVYPNPSTGAVTFDADVAGELTISSTDGRIVCRKSLEKGKSQIQLLDLNPGIYICNFHSHEGENEMFKLVYQP